MYLNATSVFNSTGGWKQRDVSPCMYLIVLTVVLNNFGNFYPRIPLLGTLHQPGDLPHERPQHDLSGRVAHAPVSAVEGLEDLGKVGHEVVVFAVPFDGEYIDLDVPPLVLGLVGGGAELELALNSYHH